MMMHSAQATTMYLLHIDPPLGRARHYLGMTRSGRLPRRLDQHARGVGAALTRAALLNGSTLRLVRTWATEGFALERATKSSGHYERLCPLCRKLPLAPDVANLPALTAKFPVGPASPSPTLNW